MKKFYHHCVCFFIMLFLFLFMVAAPNATLTDTKNILSANIAASKRQESANQSTFSPPPSVKATQETIKSINTPVVVSQISTDTSKVKAKPPGKTKAVLSMSEEKLAKLMDKAKTAMTAGNYRQAIQLYTKLLGYKTHKYSRSALELLGLAYDRNGRFAHARAEYKKYLKLYPKGEDAQRVRQRLAALETSRAKPKKKLKIRKKVKKGTRVYGSFSQFYDHYDSYNSDGDVTHHRSSVNSNLYLTVRHSGDLYDIKSAVVGGYEYDLLEVSDSISRLSRLYIDILHKRQQLSLKIGRQQSSGGGILGRFDGAVLGYSLNRYIKANLVSGIPVNTSDLDDYKDNKYFYGLNFDIGTFADSWDFNLFVINQLADGISDRQAAGAEVRYFDSKRSFFGYIDYDLSYNDLNILMLTGNSRLPTGTNINFSLDYRKSPSLSTSNAIIGQGVESLSELLKKMDEDEIRKLAQDRTSTSAYALFGVSHPVTNWLQIATDITVSKIGATKTSGGVEGMPDTGYEYLYNLQFTTSNIIKEGDVTTLVLRYSDANTYKTSSVIAKTRYPVSHKFRINPGIRVDLRESKTRDEDRLKIKPTLRMDYKINKILWLELDSGMEWDKNQSEPNDKTTSYFVSIGYRVNF